MAEFAEACCELSCPACRQPAPLVVRFQWGLVPARYASVPAPLAWLRRPSGDLSPPFESSASEGEGEWNAGAPEPGVVYAFDDDPPLVDLCCPRCQARFERVAAWIDGDVLQGAVAFLPGELARRVPAKPSGYAAVVVDADGSWQPRPDWEALEADVPVLEEV